jgi:hypothetical protein
VGGAFQQISILARKLRPPRYIVVVAARRPSIPDANTVIIRKSKSGKVRHVILTPEGANFFHEHCAGREGTEAMFRWADGSTGIGQTKSREARPGVAQRMEADWRRNAAYHKELKPLGGSQKDEVPTEAASREHNFMLWPARR